MVHTHDSVCASPARLGAAMAVCAVGIGTAAVLSVLPFGGIAPVGVALAVYAVIAVAVLAGVARHHGHPSFGAANAVTLVRAGGVAVFAGFAVEPGVVLAAGARPTFAAAAALLALDGVDGWLARRSALQSSFGARFDMEVDALFILVLAAIALGLGKAGPWVLGLGLVRYLFVAAGWLAPFLTRPLPPSFRRKGVCVLQIVALAALLLPLVAPPLSQLVAGAAFGALAWSFAVDIRWLVRARRP